MTKGPILMLKALCVTEHSFNRGRRASCLAVTDSLEAPQFSCSGSRGHGLQTRWKKMRASVHGVHPSMRRVRQSSCVMVGYFVCVFIWPSIFPSDQLGCASDAHVLHRHGSPEARARRAGSPFRYTACRNSRGGGSPIAFCAAYALEDLGSVQAEDSSDLCVAPSGSMKLQDYLGPLSRAHAVGELSPMDRSVHVLVGYAKFQQGCPFRCLIRVVFFHCCWLGLSPDHCV